MRKYKFLLCLAVAIILTGCSKTENSAVSEPSKPAIESNSSVAISVSSSPDSVASSAENVSSAHESVSVNIEKPKVGDLMGPEDLQGRGKAFCICAVTTRSADGSVKAVEYTVYDEHDNMIALIGGDSANYYTYEYDKDGNITKKYDGLRDATEEYEYKDGLAVKRHYTDCDGQTSDTAYEYDKHGTLIKTTEYAVAFDYTTVNETKPEYDAQGRLVRETDYSSNGSVFSVDEYEYNDKGEIVKETSTGDRFKYVKEYVHDERGNVLSKHQKEVKNDGTVTDETRTEYEYNSDNKKISEKKFTIENGKETPKTSWEYVYEY